jgi:hypothetical protein
MVKKKSIFQHCHCPLSIIVVIIHQSSSKSTTHCCFAVCRQLNTKNIASIDAFVIAHLPVVLPIAIASHCPLSHLLSIPTPAAACLHCSPIDGWLLYFCPLHCPPLVL